ncbi:putative membrane protein, partial [Vibrio parahaemolyticus V-223/04]
INKYLLS